jgi:Pregnancy-associated plasma protein-A
MVGSLELGGDAFFPYVVRSPQRSHLDGIRIMNPSLGGAHYAAQALVHEVGHFLGLLHTFEVSTPLWKFAAFCGESTVSSQHAYRSLYLYCCLHPGRVRNRRKVSLRQLSGVLLCRGRGSRYVVKRSVEWSTTVSFP